MSFLRIVLLLKRGELVDIVAHPNPSRYPGQKVLVVNVDNYAWLVPFVASDGRYFVKTVIPSRKATKKYLEACDEG